MARLNELPMSADSLETRAFSSVPTQRSLTAPVRRKMLRQNRDLAKCNNVRALRIRELENECACMLSENLELRGRILELEKQVQDNDARRIADHALAIKAKLESQLTEWGSLLAGLGLEPPIKRHSPRITKPLRQRMSFGAGRPSPSQRRLRDVARDIEELGHIAENKSYPRRSMNPQQILALRSEADETDSPELGPPPMSKFLDEDPVKVDSPSRPTAVGTPESSPKPSLEPPVSLLSPKHETTQEPPPPAEVKTGPAAAQASRPQPDTAVETTPSPQPINKTGSKRKFTAADDSENVSIERPTCEGRNQALVLAETQPTRENPAEKTLHGLANVRRATREKKGPAIKPRKALAAKSTNHDISSPRKSCKLEATDEVAAVKADLAKSKASHERSRPKAKKSPPVKMDQVPVPELPPPATIELATPLAEPALLSLGSPEPVSRDNVHGGDTPPRDNVHGGDTPPRDNLHRGDTPPRDNLHRGDTPPPADISSKGETSRPSRRSRAAISYAEPNLRDKMRRPTKELVDAVAGEGKFAQRSSQAEAHAPDTAKAKRESDAGLSPVKMPAVSAQTAEPEADSTPPSPLASRSSSPQVLPDTVVTDRRRRLSASSRAAELADDGASKTAGKPDADADTSGSGDVDIYEFTSSSPQTGKDKVAEPKKTNRRQAIASSRRLSAAVDNQGPGARDRSNSSRRRSMMV